ncbi:hypothetical protein ACFV3R_21415 [Streptomyces sp. NPDC059740]|uniref:hypothetical protein n=1 Tax=Streptomyces sp. NPDC059740 TaxID=3346926 RepID=UPI00366807ED
MAGRRAVRWARRGPRRVRRACLAAGAALLLPATLVSCGGAVTATDADAGVQRMLDVRARAVRDHDEQAFLAGVDPGAASFRAAQRRTFEHLAAVPLADWQYRLTDTDAFPLPAGRGERIAARVELRYRVRGYDAAPVVAVQYLTLARRDGDWRVLSDTDGEDSGKVSMRQLWDDGPVSLVRGRRSLVIGARGEDGRLRELARRTDGAVPAVADAWPGRWSRRVVVEAPPTVARMAELLGSDQPAGYTGIAAVTTGEAGGSAQAPADRVIVNPDAYAQLTDAGRAVVLTHETTHVATRARTTASTPLWLSEGFADWVAYRRTKNAPHTAAPELTAAAAAHRLPGKLPTNDDFGFTRKPDDLARAYEGSWLACRMVADEWGERKLTGLYEAAGRDSDLDAVLRDRLHVSTADFTRRWRAYLAKVLNSS